MPFVVKSTSTMMNDRSCYGKELKIVIFPQELRIHVKFRLFCQNESTTLPRSIPQRKYILGVLPACWNM